MHSQFFKKTFFSKKCQGHGKMPYIIYNYVEVLISKDFVILVNLKMKKKTKNLVALNNFFFQVENKEF